MTCHICLVQICFKMTCLNMSWHDLQLCLELVHPQPWPNAAFSSRLLIKYEVYFVGRGGCKQFYAEAAYNYKQVTSVWEWHDDVSTSNDVAFLNDVTLMTHMSADRIQMLALLIEHWEGPLAFSVYGSFKSCAISVQKFRTTHISWREITSIWI